MFSIYERYTSHFGHKLDRPFVKDRSDVGDVGTVCAYEHRPHNKQDAYFCTHMDIRLPAGQEVTGGFHAQIEEVAPKNVGLPYGCFGDALDEGQCDYLPGGQRATTLP